MDFSTKKTKPMSCYMLSLTKPSHIYFPASSQGKNLSLWLTNQNQPNPTKTHQKTQQNTEVLILVS